MACFIFGLTKRLCPRTQLQIRLQGLHRSGCWVISGDHVKSRRDCSENISCFSTALRTKCLLLAIFGHHFRTTASTPTSGMSGTWAPPLFISFIQSYHHYVTFTIRRRLQRRVPPRSSAHSHVVLHVRGVSSFVYTWFKLFMTFLTAFSKLSAVLVHNTYETTKTWLTVYDNIFPPPEAQAHRRRTLGSLPPVTQLCPLTNRMLRVKRIA